MNRRDIFKVIGGAVAATVVGIPAAVRPLIDKSTTRDWTRATRTLIIPKGDVAKVGQSYLGKPMPELHGLIATDYKFSSLPSDESKCLLRVIYRDA